MWVGDAFIGDFFHHIEISAGVGASGQVQVHFQLYSLLENHSRSCFFLWSLEMKNLLKICYGLSLVGNRAVHLAGS